MTLTVHHLENSRSQRVLFLLEELGVPYEVRRYRRNPRTMLAPAELRAVHPLGKSPLVTDGERTLAETGAIMEYLASHHGDGTLMGAPGSKERERVTYYLHYAEGSLMPLMLLQLVVSRLPQSPPKPLRPLLRPLLRGIVGGVDRQFLGPQLDLHLNFLDRELEGRQFFAGDTFTVADAQMSFPIEIAGLRLKALGAARPNLQGWLDRLRVRPAYARALERGGPYKIG
ncbi:glutathione S-transferase family protein [Lichenicoccus roseus]|uniref:glutathione transferase n=1 Tax=Lichenicoccus roseus TaxID=2683649 RepID=A0A5R9JDK7_9PROT|nr:glutathione S-transferase [Lichenicoccus roseus]TLU73701.1 glutathione S-transferase [Lichenicoccus roseus]